MNDAMLDRWNSAMRLLLDRGHVQTVGEEYVLRFMAASLWPDGGVRVPAYDDARIDGTVCDTFYGPTEGFCVIESSPG